MFRQTYGRGTLKQVVVKLCKRITRIGLQVYFVSPAHQTQEKIWKVGTFFFNTLFRRCKITALQTLRIEKKLAGILTVAYLHNRFFHPYFSECGISDF